MNSFTTVIYTFQGVKTYNNWTVHEYKCLFLTFIFLQIERERESGIQNLGIKENGPKVTYLVFRQGSTGESFFFHGLIDFVLFLIMAWRTRVSHVSVLLLSLTRSTGYGSSARYGPYSKTKFLTIYFRWGEGVPTSVLGSQPIIWLLSLLFRCPVISGH